MIWYIVLFAIGLIFGFLLGTLVYRNNAKKAAQIIAVIQSNASSADKLKQIAAILGLPFIS